MTLKTNSTIGMPSESISGCAMRIDYHANGNTIVLYRLNGDTFLQMSKASIMGYPIVDGKPLQDFADYKCTTEQKITGILGVGERMTIVSRSASTGLTRTYILETSATSAGVFYTQTSYQAGDHAVTASRFVDNIFELCNLSDRVWSYNGGGEGPANRDTVQKIDLTNHDAFVLENVHDHTAACIPVADIYTADGGITIGDASARRREVHTPVAKTDNSAQVSINWPGKAIAAHDTVAAGQSFVVVHSCDYFSGLRGYKNAMESIGMVMPATVPNRSYEPRWESWGWGFNWTIDLIISKLDELESIGIKQITLDDGWYDSAGDWGLLPSKFPNGVADMLRLTDAIHAHGMSALLWWRPCDGGRDSKLFREHPEYFVINAAGKPARLMGSGVTESTYQDTSVMGYALCPRSEGAIASQLAFVNRAMKEWGFDGFKQDYVWSMPKCYNPDHHHAYPEDSTETQSDFYRTAWETMMANDPDCFNMLCNCGFPQDYYSLRYMTQVVTADPISIDQTRRRTKAYKALMGDYFPITTDHNKVWYPSTIGTGAVMVERRALVGAGATSYAKWTGIANELEIHKGRFIGDLYNYGFDPYESYVVEKDGVMYYAFFCDGLNYQPVGHPDVELRGLDHNKLYRIVDYVNNRVVATNLKGDNAVFSKKFATELLVKAVELTQPDDPSIVQDDLDSNHPTAELNYERLGVLSDRIVYSGAWSVEHNDEAHEKTAKYTDETGASATLTFHGTAVRLYGRVSMKDYASSDIYLDGAQLEAAFAYGIPTYGQLLFEVTGLPEGEHTFRIARFSGHLCLEYMEYATETQV